MSAFQPITVQNLSVSFADRLVLKDVSFSVSPGERVALVGENGAGKSTVLRAIAGTLDDTARSTGRISRPLDLVWLDQEPPFADESTVAEAIESVLAPLHRAVQEVEELSQRLDDPAAAARFDEVLSWAESHDAWDVDRRAQLLRDEFALADIDPGRQVGTLSGGQRSRLALATVLSRRPDALLLDEPTNHLDDATLELLAEHLCALATVVLFASHDRVFLDDVATALIDLDATAFGTDGMGGRRFGGGWSDYEQARVAARRRWEEQYALEQEELKRLRAATRIGADKMAHNRGPRDNDKFIYKFKGANVDRALARRKHDAERALAEAQERQVSKPPRELEFTARLAANTAPGPMIMGIGLVVSGRLRLDEFVVDAGEHVLVTGPNGAGKSTLLGVLAQRIPLDAGSLAVTTERIAELTQDPYFADLSRTPLQLYEPLEKLGFPALREFGLLHMRDAVRPVGALSVGQRRRFALAVIIATSPELLLLDEPTNHISLALASELEEAMGTSTGTIVVASHDRWLRRRWTGREITLA